MKDKYPNPRPTQTQVDAIKAFCRDTNTPLPELEYMTKNQAGKWYRLHKDRCIYDSHGEIISKVIITTYKDGRVCCERVYGSKYSNLTTNIAPISIKTNPAITQ